MGNICGLPFDRELRNRFQTFVFGACARPGAASQLTCRLSSRGAGLQGHSRSRQRRRWPSARRSPSCPCCRCETLNRRRSLWSTPGTARPWSHRRTRDSPGTGRRILLGGRKSCGVSQGGRTRERCRRTGDGRNLAASFNPPQLQLQGTFCSLPGFLTFVCLFFQYGHPSLSPLRSQHLPSTVRRCGSLTCRVKCVFAVVYKQDVAAIRSNPICFQIRGTQRTARWDREKNPQHTLAHKAREYNKHLSRPEGSRQQ